MKLPSFAHLPNLPRIGITVGLSVIALIASASLAFLAVGASFQAEYEGKIYPGAMVGPVSVGGLTPTQALERVQARIDEALAPGLAFELDDQTVTLPSQDKPFVTYDAETAVQQAFALGRQASFLQNTVVLLGLRLQAIRLPLKATIDRELVEATLKTALTPFTQTTADAELHVRLEKDTASPTIEIQPERVGNTVDTQTLWPNLEQQVNQLAFSPIRLQTTRLEPSLTAAEIEPLRTQVPAILGFSPFRVTAERREWVVTSSTRAAWIMAEKTEDGVRLVANPDEVKKSLEPLVKPFLIDKVDGKLDLEAKPDENYTFKNFTAPVEGIQFEGASTTAAINAFFAAPTSTPVTIVLQKVQPTIEGDLAAQLGIREALGTGRSNFSGSPANRRHNITLGKDRVDGTLVAPGQDFSMLKTLGPVTGENGWLPELVIKGNKTVPEFGGGLCQIGTTAFRTAIEAGLEITERRNHSYRVRYYEPAGTDATIYEPAPDFRFKNDTPNWILVTGAIKGDEVFFTIWGTKDGRVSSYTKPKIWNITAPPPTKYIETTDLKPGQVKCTESAHSGAEASFDYSVTSATGETKKVTFYSKYVPWQAVCLKGVEKISTPESVIDQTGGNNLN